MTVYISPAQLDKPVKVWDGVKSLSMAVNSVGEIIVAEYERDIVRVFSEFTEAVTTSLTPIARCILPEICAFIVDFSCTVVD